MLKRQIALSCLILALALPGAARAEIAVSVPSPAPVASPSRIDPNFLLLPAYDLQWVNPPKSIRVGDTLSARLIAESAASGKAPAESLSKDLQVHLPAGTENADHLSFEWSEELTTGSDGSLQLSLTPITPGQLTIPSLALADRSGKPVARTVPVTLNVVSSISADDPKPKNPDPPRPPVSLGIPVATLIVLAILVLLLVVGVVFWLVRWSRSRRSDLPGAPAEPEKSEDELALAKLAQLEKKGLLRAGQFKAHYFGVSEIIKHYIGKRYGFDAAESTTFEMISHLEGNPGAPGAASSGFAPQTAIDSLRSMFERLDRVKFTDHVPVPIEGAELLEEARKLVTMTRRPPPVLAGVSEGSTTSASR